MIKSRKDFIDYTMFEGCSMPHFFALFGICRNTIKLFQYWLRYNEYLTNSEHIFLRSIRLLFSKYKLQKYKMINGFTIPLNCIDRGLRLPHYGGITINGKSRIGKNCCIRPYTVIGSKYSGKMSEAPNIGDNCDIGCNVSIIGDITIGDNVCIGAGSVVIKDVPSNCTVVGNPCRIILKSKIKL